LAEFEDELVQEIVEDYEEHFTEGAAKGKTEEEIIAELGSVEELVNELCELQGREPKYNKMIVVMKNGAENETGSENRERNEKDTYNKTYSGSWHSKDGGSNWSNTESFAGSFDSMMRGIGKAVECAMKEAGRVIEDAMEQVEIHMEEAKRKRAYYEEAGSFSESYGSSEKENREEPNIEQTKEGMDGCRRILLDARIADVTICQSRNAGTLPKATCRYYSHKTAMMYPFYAYQEGDTFYVGVQKQEQTERKSGFFQINISPSIEIELTVPEGVSVLQGGSISGDIKVETLEIDNIKLQTQSGDVRVEGCTVKEIGLKTQSGDVAMGNTKVNVLEVCTSSGDQKYSGIEATGMSCSSSSGDHEVYQVTAERAVFHTASGDVAIRDARVKQLDTGSSSGDVCVNNCEGGCMNADSASGDITVEADFKEYHIRSRSGDVRLMNRYDADIQVSGTSGDVAVYVAKAEAGYYINTHTVSGECVVSERGDLQIAEKKYTLDVRTVSGDISVKFA